MTGLFWILLCWLLGNLLSRLCGGYVSGNIIGMLLLFVLLSLKWVKAEAIRPAARFLLDSMALFFVPFGVGLMVSYRIIAENLWAIVTAAGISTIVVLVVTGRLFQRMDRRKRPGKDASPFNRIP